MLDSSKRATMSRGRASSLTAAIGNGPDENKWWENSVEAEEEGVWRALVTEEGVDYYLNIETRETTWDKVKGGDDEDRGGAGRA